MPSLDSAGQALRHQLGAKDPDLFRDVPDTEGYDEHAALSMTIDAARRVVGVHVKDASKLRTNELLETAIKQSFAAADGKRGYASMVEAGRGEELLERAERTLAGHRTERPRRRIDVSREGSLARLAAKADRAPEAKRQQPRRQTSDNGYLTIQRGLSLDPTSIQADPAWLAGARAEHLEAAISQALTVELTIELEA